MKKSVTILAALLLVVFATGCTINVEVEDDDLDINIQDNRGDFDSDNDGDIDADDEPLDEVVVEINEEVIEPTGALDGPVTVTVEEGENMNAYLTYLKRTAHEENWFDWDSEACQYLYQMKTDESFPMTIEDFEDSGVQRSLLEIMGDKEQAGAFIAAVIDYLENSDDEAYQVCKSDNGVFMFFSEDHSQITLTAWDEDGLSLDVIKSFYGLIDLSYRFEPNVLDSKSILMTGYGDAGHLSWNYYLIDEGKNIEQVESCSGSSSSSGDQGEVHDQFTFECEMEYTG